MIDSPSSFDSLFARDRAPYQFGASTPFPAAASGSRLFDSEGDFNRQSQPSPGPMDFSFQADRIFAPTVASRMAILHMATAEQLQLSGNAVYLQVLATIARLESDNSILRAEKQILQNSFNALTMAMSSGTASATGVVSSAPAYVSLPIVTLRREDYLNVPFWTRDEYTDHLTSIKGVSAPNPRGGRAVSQGINNTAIFLVDQQGSVISGFLVAEIKRSLRDILQALKERGRAPDSWTKGSPQDRLACYAEIEHQYPLLRLCHNHWKAEWLLIHMYSQWRLNHITPTVPVTIHVGADDSDDEVIVVGSSSDDNNDAPGGGRGVKRCRIRSRTKKAKTASQSSTATGLQSPIASPATQPGPLPLASEPPVEGQDQAALPHSAEGVATEGMEPSSAAEEAEENIFSDITYEVSNVLAEAPLPVAPTDVASTNAEPTPLMLQNTNLGEAVASLNSSDTQVSAMLEDTEPHSSIVQDPDAPSGGPSAGTADAVGPVHSSASTQRARARGSAQERIYEPQTARITAKSICGHEWKETHPTGTEAEFNAHWSHLAAEGRAPYLAAEKVQKAEIAAAKGKTRRG